MCGESCGTFLEAFQKLVTQQLSPPIRRSRGPEDTSLISTSMMEVVRGSVMTLSSFGAFSPDSMLKDLIRMSVSLKRAPVAASSGRRISTDSQLKKSWTVAPANALKANCAVLTRNWLLFD